MVSSAASTVTDYLESLPADRRAAISAVRRTIRKHLPKGYQEVMQYGMLSYVVPLSRYGNTYNGQPLAIASLASQKGYMALYLMGLYGDRQAWFAAEYAKSGKKLDMGKACVRFKTLEDLPLDLVGKVIASVGVDDFVAFAEAHHPKRRAATKKAAKKATKKALKA